MNRATLYLALPAICLLGCRPTTRVERTLSEARTLMESRPDSALTLLRTITAEQLPGRRLRAEHALLHSQALDKNFIDLKSDSVIAPAVDYYSKHGDPREKAYTNYYLGCIRYNANQIDRAVRVMVTAESHALKTDDSYLLARIYSCLGRMFQDQQSFEEAQAMYDRAEKYFLSDGDTVNVAHIAMNRAMVLSSLARSEEAISEYRRAQHLFERAGDRMKVYEMSRNIVNELKKDARVPTDSLKRLLRTAYAASTDGIPPAADYPLWASLHIREHNLDSARYYLKRQLADPEESPNVRCGVLMQLCRLEEQAGNYNQAVEYWHRYYDLFNAIVADWKSELVQEAEKRYRNQELRYSNRLLRLRNTYINIGWVLVVVLGLGVLGTIWIRTIRRYKQFIDALTDNYDAFRERYQQLAREMENGSEEESCLLKALETKLKGLQDLLDKAYNPRKPHTFIDDFKDYVKTISEDETAFADLQYVVNKRSYGLVDYLREHHPGLTDYELDMLCMLRFGFSFNCIRLLHHHNNIYSLYSRRTKIHRKLGLPPHYRLEDYLEETTRRLREQKENPESVPEE